MTRLDLRNLVLFGIPNVKQQKSEMKPQIDINGGRLLYIEVLKNHEISDLELKKLKIVADIYPFDPQLVLFMHLKTKYHGNLASKYAYDLLSVKYQPWFYRLN